MAKDPSKSVESSFSQQIKQQQIPKGSFGIAKTKPYKPDEKYQQYRQEYERERVQFMRPGSRMLALETATDTILKAAMELETDVRKEVKYWEDILTISAKGWPLQRLRRDMPYSPLAVRCGTREASEQFRGRGLVPLRMNKEGNIFLDPDLAPKPRTLRVRISEHGEIIGSSRLSSSDKGSSSDIENSIRLARDSLFEEELFQEMAIEARSLLAYGVELHESVLHVQTSPSRTVLIDSILRHEEPERSDDNRCDWLAHTIAEGLRLMLTHEHRMRLYRRSQTPPPLTLTKRQVPSPPLLRTLLAMFSHINATNSLQGYLQHLVETLTTAGLNMTLDMTPEASWGKLSKIITESPIQGMSPLDQILQHFVNPLDSITKITLPSAKKMGTEHVTIAARTFFGPPTFGTEYKVSLPPSLARALSLGRDARHDFKFSTGEELTEYVDWIYSLHLSHTLLRHQYPRKVALHCLEPRITITVKDGKKEVKKEVLVQVAKGDLTLNVGPTASFIELKEQSLPQAVSRWRGKQGEGAFLAKIKGALGR